MWNAFFMKGLFQNRLDGFSWKDRDKAQAILQNVAKVNKKEMPSEDILVPVTMANKGVLELFKTWYMARLSLIQIYVW